MENPSFIALSQQMALSRHMEVVANNLANMNTPSFKAERLVFTELLHKAAGLDVDDMGPMSFVEAHGTYLDFSEGSMTPTGNPLDVAIAGDGFFAVQTADGTAYTRAGRFSLDATGTLVTSDGLPVLAAGGGPVQINQSAQVSIAGDGTISGDDGVIARLQVVRFEDEQSLLRGPNGIYSPGDQAPLEVASPQVVQGMVEGSNVSPILEMTRLIDVSRSYQRMTQIIESEHQRQKQAISVLAKAG
ncbi:MAG: flagellar basal-body rod protein FlgF [Alphaproteobacteria bacterium]